MKRLFVGVGMVVAVALLRSVAVAQETDPAGEEQMLARINELRAQGGVGAVVRDAALDQAARVHSADMAWNNYLDHVSPRTGDPGARVAAAGLSASLIAENVAMHRSAQNAEETLEGSEVHRTNMVDGRFTRVGLSVVRGQRGYYVTQVFARRADEPLPAPAPAEGGQGAAAGSAAASLGAGAVVAGAGVGASVSSGPGAAVGAGASGAGAASGALTAAGGVATAGGAVAGTVGATAQPAQAAGVAAQAAVPQRGVTSSGVAQGALPPPAVSSPAAQAPGRRIAGYWVYSNGRWWYYPATPGAQPVPQTQQMQPPASTPYSGWTYPAPGQRWQQNGTYTYPYQYNYQAPGYQYQPRRRTYYYGR